ncbi:MAG: Gfo/Idh/MocA family oxidoreductase [Clostridiales bacterium]|jgi:predicted dehydrogenase|nr:Gfo/Idh/MocA family oxidoreductase [Clostridiales bacterium]
MKKIRWGIIGTGNIAATFARALNSMEDSSLYGVASRNVVRAGEFAKRFKIEKSYGSYEELAKDPDIDVVYIGVPHTEHKNMAKLCIENKKAVLCEKPFAINSKDSEELISMAKEYNVFLMEAMWTKFLPTNLRVKQWIKEGRIGKILHIKATFGFYSDYDPDSRLYNPSLGGGALLDVGVYPISYITFLLDKAPDKIISSAIIGASGVDEQNVLVFQYKDGILADLSSSISCETGNDALIVGEKGIIKVNHFWRAESAKLYDNSYKCLDEFKEPFIANGYEYEAAEVNRCLREGLKISPLNPLTDTLSNMRLMDEIRKQWGLVYPGE